MSSPQTPASVVPEIPGVALDRIPGVYPRGNRLLVIRHREDTSAGGIVIPDSAQQPTKKATVLAVGPGARDPRTGERIPIEYVAGDVVLLYAYAGSEFKVRGVECVLVEDTDILASVDPAELLD